MGQRRGSVGAGLKGDLGRRLVTLVAVAAVVGGVLAVLAVAGVLGKREAGSTEEGVAIAAAQMVEPPPSPGELAKLAVEARKGAIAPDFEFSDLEGERHRLSDFRGHPVYLNFWASWCRPCRTEMADIQELLDRHGDSDGLVVIALNRAEGLDKVKSYLADIERLDGSRGVSFTVSGLDPSDAVFPAYRGLGMPTSIFIDKDGVIRFAWTGLLRLAEMEAAFQDTVAAASGG